jgi:hypothetical protein
MGAKVSEEPARFSIQKMEAAVSSETLLLIYQTRRLHLSEDRNLKLTCRYGTYKNNISVDYVLAECRTTNTLIIKKKLFVLNEFHFDKNKRNFV